MSKEKKLTFSVRLTRRDVDALKLINQDNSLSGGIESILASKVYKELKEQAVRSKILLLEEQLKALKAEKL